MNLTKISCNDCYKKSGVKKSTFEGVDIFVKMSTN